MYLKFKNTCTQTCCLSENKCKRSKHYNNCYHRGNALYLDSFVYFVQPCCWEHSSKIYFLCSPVLAEKNLLEGIGKKLKKNNVALDIVSFGEEDGDKGEKLEALLNAVNSNDNSHIVHINGGERVLSDVLIR